MHFLMLYFYGLVRRFWLTVGISFHRIIEYIRLLHGFSWICWKLSNFGTGFHGISENLSLHSRFTDLLEAFSLWYRIPWNCRTFSVCTADFHGFFLIIYIIVPVLYVSECMLQSLGIYWNFSFCGAGFHGKAECV